MQFNLKQTAIFQAIRWRRLFQAAGPLAAFLALGFLAGLGFVIANISGLEAKSQTALAKAMTEPGLKKTLGFSVLSLMLSLIFWESGLFFRSCLKKPKLKISLEEALKNPEPVNFACFLDFEAALALKKALAFCQNRQGLAGLPTALFYFTICSKNKALLFVFEKAELNLNRLKDLLKNELNQAGQFAALDFGKAIIASGLSAKEQAKERIGIGDLLSAFSQHNKIFQQFLLENDLQANDIFNLVYWFSRKEKIKQNSQKWWSKQSLAKMGAVARDFVNKYSYYLDKYSTDLREKIKKGGLARQITGYEKEIVLIERVLAKQGFKNVLLVGQEAKNCFDVVEKIAQRAFTGLSPEGVRYKRIMDLDLAMIANQAQNQEQAETLLETCFSEALKAGNIILCLKNLPNFVKPTALAGTINISAILTKYLALPDFQIIALATFVDFHDIIDKNSALSSLFEKVEIQEISEKETLEELENSVSFFEAKHKRLIGYKALREILRLSSRYFPQLSFPEKATRLLDEAMAFLALSAKGKILQPKHIKKIVAEKTQMPLEELEQKEKETLLGLEDLIHQRLINQEQAVSGVANAMRRARAEINIKSGPIGSFLFLGPTGVGKTETAKILCDLYFGSEQKMIRFDMSEFQLKEDVKRLIGTSQENGLLTTKVKEDPFSLLLLDELEKSHPDVLNLFLQVQDEGWLTDGLGRKIDFKNAIIIATSNAGSTLIQEGLRRGQASEKIKDDLMAYLTHQGIFKPEFLNRFDGIIFFKPLGKPEFLKIAQLMLAKLANNLLDKGVRLDISLPLKEKIVELSYSPEFGAREMQRVIQDKIENVLAKALLSGELKRGQRITIEPDNFQIITL